MGQIIVLPPQHNLKVALTWARAGFQVLPCGSDKSPLGRLVPRGHKDAVSDEKTIRSWWSRRPDAIPALVPGSLDLIVFDLDVDKKTGERIGEASWENIKELCSLDDTRALKIPTPSGGMHIYLSRPSQLKDIGNTSPARKIDTRCDGGYVIAPGTVLPDGKMYGNADSVEHVALAAIGYLPVAPTALLRSISKEAPTNGSGVVEPDQPAMISRANSYLIGEAALAVEGDQGDMTTFKVATWLHDLGVSETMANILLLELWNDRCSPPWLPDELAKKVRNAYSYANGPHGGKSSEFLFHGVRPPPPPDVGIGEPANRRPRKGWHGDDWLNGTSWLFHEMLPASGVVAIVGPSGAGKSFLTMNLAKSLASGEPFFAVMPEAIGGTIIVAAEAVGTINRRLAGLTVDGQAGRSNEFAQMRPESRLPIGWIEAQGLSSQAALAALEAEIEAMQAEMKNSHNVPLRMIVVDTLRASGLVRDENSNSDMAQAMSTLAALAARINALVVVVHHPRKDRAIEAGAGAFLNAVDALIMIERADKQPVRSVTLNKSRDAEERGLGSFTLHVATIGFDTNNNPITTCYVQTSTNPTTTVEHEPKTLGLFIECVDQLKEPLDGTSGAQAARADHVRKKYYSRYSGSGGKRAQQKAYKGCVDYAIRHGIVREKQLRNEKYLMLAPAIADQDTISAYLKSVADSQSPQMH